MAAPFPIITYLMFKRFLMLQNRSSIVKALVYSQLDKLLFTLSLMLVMPILFHMIPYAEPYPIGAIWLPMFYAPLFAAIVYKKHVSIAACIISPWINMLLIGMPRSEVASKLTFELIFFALFAQLLCRSKNFCKFIGLLSFVFAKTLSNLIAYFVAGNFVWDKVSSELALAFPGIIVLLILGGFSLEVKERWSK